MLFNFLIECKKEPLIGSQKVLKISSRYYGKTLRSIFYLLVLIPSLSYASGLEFFEILKCGKVIVCTDIVIAKDAKVYLLHATKSFVCEAKAMHSFYFKSMRVPDREGLNAGSRETFDATKIWFPASCGNITDYRKGVVVDEIKYYTIIKSLHIDDKKKVDHFDKLIRNSPAISCCNLPGFDEKILNRNPKIDKAIQFEFNRTKATIVVYLADMHGNHEFSPIVTAIILSKKVFTIPTEGTIENDTLFAFEINGRQFIETYTGCGACDSWSGKEIFEVNNNSITKVHVGYHRLRVPDMQRK